MIVVTTQSFYSQNMALLTWEQKPSRSTCRDIIANYPDFPKQGILFRDINPVFKRNDALNYIADEFYSIYGKAKVDRVAGIESRGFIIATALALRFGRGIVMVRKAGKLRVEPSRNPTILNMAAR